MPDFDPRRAEPGQRFGYTTADGRQREIRADDDGIVVPKNHEDVRVLDAFDLPRAQVDAPKRTAKRSSSTKRSNPTATKAPAPTPAATADATEPAKAEAKPGGDE